MALPYLIKHIYNNATEETVRRGKKIFFSGYVEQISYDELGNSVIFRTRDDAYNNYYKVYITRFASPHTLTIRCTCPYNLGEVCRHQAGALFRLQEIIDKNELSGKEPEYNQQHTTIKMKQLEIRMIKLYSSFESFEEAEIFVRRNKINIQEAANDTVKAIVATQGQSYHIVFHKNEERNFDTSCTCTTETKHPLCVHKTIVLLHLLNTHGTGFFESIANRDRDKNKLLALYGYTLDDDLKGKFEFTFRDGRPFLKVLDPSIQRITAPAAPTPTYTLPQQKQKEDTAVLVENQKLGIVFSYSKNQYPNIQMDAVQGNTNETGNGFLDKVERLDLTKFINTDALGEDDKLLVQHMRKVLPGEINRYLNRNSPFSGIWENIIVQEEDELPEETRRLIIEFLHPKFKKVFTDDGLNGFVFTLPPGKSFQTANLLPCDISGDFIQPSFIINEMHNGYEINCFIKTGNTTKGIEENEWDSSLLFKKNGAVYLWQSTEDAMFAESFMPSGKKFISIEDWPKQLTEFVLPLSKNYELDFGNLQKEEIKNVKPLLKILLQEKGEYLLFIPYFTYNEYDVQQADKEKIVIPSAGKLLILQRNPPAERELINKIETLHSSFIRPGGEGILALRGSEVIKNNWFFLFVDAVKELDVPVFGFDALKKFRFNTAKPTTKIYLSSHTDWFDAKVDIHFGNQKVTVADVKKALSNKQQYVPLPDGTLGVLPEDWIKKYSLLFRIGEGKATNLTLSKYHFSIIEDLYEKRDEEEIFFKLEEKYENLKNNHTIQNLEPPFHLKNILRPYQAYGFQWLSYLNDVNWGGILADDMGLGKTVQALSFLYHLKEKKGILKALVVCPTTLMFNWENEIRKFTPSLTWNVHHGSTRSMQTEAFEKADIIITTYGTLRSDIQLFAAVPFDYTILDESQAIKNPNSKVAKAACLLNSKSRICMSGTPLQNNTFDIYAQMNFLNPGMLGSMDHFKNEFAVPIDKFGEPEQKEHLRKLLFPFILRRTKEQVAKDLPDKTEMILYCEMEDEQRKIYDAYRNDFRDRVLGVMDDASFQRSQLTILQGLMKLRQICDSPAILKGVDEDYPNVSVKLDELGREISENIGNHKALVFSQFLGMLALIKEKLNELGIAYEYFDGSTSADGRQRAITHFQEDDNCRVFLISLKAGGVGLNLTAADYVYIVDPWWNPAVEQQAIDRTHRIGQTKNIFAYRMICKDTVEDKIIKLQEKKKALAADLITDDSGFVKNLTRQDLEYLFS